MSAQARQVSSLFKIARWGVLGAGLSYGFLRARSLRSEAEERRISQAYDRKVALIAEAKRKFAEMNAPPSTGAGETFNFEDPNFDADKWFKHVEATYK
ncbi:F1F0 ATP synthase subunit e, mitochondrial [Coemansia nantahalensis]|nr:F1F0 ATP synthase subunit e, mitochondrial [Coemansia nantahalensis]